jgi:hypothetical protein
MAFVVAVVRWTGAKKRTPVPRLDRPITRRQGRRPLVQGGQVGCRGRGRCFADFVGEYEVHLPIVSLVREWSDRSHARPVNWRVVGSNPVRELGTHSCNRLGPRYRLVAPGETWPPARHRSSGRLDRCRLYSRTADASPTHRRNPFHDERITSPTSLVTTFCETQ